MSRHKTTQLMWNSFESSHREMTDNVPLRWSYIMPLKFLTRLHCVLAVATRCGANEVGRSASKVGALSRSQQTRVTSSLTNKNHSRDMIELKAEFFGSTAVFGKDFQSAWDNLVTAVIIDERKLHLVTDFDHTLTTFTSKQCHDVIALHDEYPEEFRQEFTDICAMVFSTADFHTWWRIAHDLIVDKSGLTEEMFHRGIKSAGIQLRSGTVELIAYCRASKIPTIITSAGITNVIAAVLESHGVSSIHDEHFHIDANHMEFHADDGTLLSILPVIPVHSKAKKHVHIRAPHMFTSLEDFIQSEQQGQQESVADVVSSGKECLEESVREGGDVSIGFSPTIAGTEVESVMDNILGVTAKEEESSQEETNSMKEQVRQRGKGIAAIVLGDNAGDFEVLSELSEMKEAFLFRLGYATDQAKADKLLSLDCCDVILIGDDHCPEIVLKLLQKLIDCRDNR